MGEAERLKQITQNGDDGDETDGRSIYVGNVDYGASPEELQEHFKACGPINRITILVNKLTGQPKGFAYVEFAEDSTVENALLLHDSLFRGRQLKVMAKRTNLPGFGKGKKGKGKGKSKGKSPYGKGYYGGYSPWRPRGKGKGYRPY